MVVMEQMPAPHRLPGLWSAADRRRLASGQCRLATHCRRPAAGGRDGHLAVAHCVTVSARYSLGHVPDSERRDDSLFSDRVRGVLG